METIQVGLQIQYRCFYAGYLWFAGIIMLSEGDCPSWPLSRQRTQEKKKV